MLVGCSFGGTSWSCAQQADIARELAAAEVFRQVSTFADPISAHTSTACDEGSGGAMVTASGTYALKEALAGMSLRAAGTAVTGTAGWQSIAEIGSGDPGSGGTSLVCYRSTDSEDPTYLRLHVYGPPTLAAQTFEVELSRAEHDVELCPQL